VPTMVGQLDGKSDQDLADIAAYFASQEGSGGQTKADLRELGEKVYRSGVAERNVAACIACHSPTGQGNAPAGYPALAGQHAQYIADQLRAYRKGYEDDSGRTNDGEAMIMRTTAFGLSDKEISIIAKRIPHTSAEGLATIKQDFAELRGVDLRAEPYCHIIPLASRQTTCRFDLPALLGVSVLLIRDLLFSCACSVGQLERESTEAVLFALCSSWICGSRPNQRRERAAS